MNKADLINDIADTHDLPKTKAAAIVDHVFEQIVETVKAGDDVRLVGFGTFSSRRKEATEARNPRTGEKVQVPAQTVPKFVAGKPFKNALNAA